MVTLLTGWQSVLARIGMVGLIAGSLFFWGYFKGREHESAVYAAYRAKEAKIAALEASKAALQAKQQRETTARIEGDYASQITALRARSRADWLRYQSGAGSVPAVPQASGKPDEASAYELLAETCAETTQQLTDLQEWVRSVKQ